MDALDRRIIHELQENFPLAPHPYEIMAGRLGICLEALWERVCVLVASQVIRRIGFSIDSRKIGYFSTLAAIRVPPEQVEQASAVMMQYPQITHSYLRDHAFAIWFTVIAEDERRILTILEDLRTALNVSDADMMNLPVKKLFKLDARFK